MKLQICILFALRIYITIQQTSHLSWPLDPFSIQRATTGYPSPLKPIYQMQKDLMVPQMTRHGNVLRPTPKEQVGSENDYTRPVWLYSLYYVGKRSVQCAISSVTLPLIFSLMQYGSYVNAETGIPSVTSCCLQCLEPPFRRVQPVSSWFSEKLLMTLVRYISG